MALLIDAGYGHLVPRTFGGRMFCMGFALVGIPLTLIVIADLGRLFASGVSSIVKRIPRLSNSCSSTTSIAGRRSMFASGIVCFFFVYLAAGAGLFVIWEDDWTFFDGFYFCFVSMTTIGFGDLVPQKPEYMLICTLYILLGLALTSTIIELVRRQYTYSWRRIQALSGPLADALRRLGEAATGGSNSDGNTLQQDIGRVLTVICMPQWMKEGGDNSLKGGKAVKQQKEWEEAMEAVIRDITAGTQRQHPPLVQLVIYESSV